MEYEVFLHAADFNEVIDAAVFDTHKEAKEHVRFLIHAEYESSQDDWTYQTFPRTGDITREETWTHKATGDWIQILHKRKR